MPSAFLGHRNGYKELEDVVKSLRTAVRGETSEIVGVSEASVAARAAAWALAASVASYWVVDPDLWGHLRFGLDAIRDRAIAHVDPYSFTSDVPWINHEWLSEIIMGLAYLAGGIPAMLLLKVGILGSAYFVLASRLSRAPAPARWWLMAIAVLATAPIATTFRPQLWTILALTILMATVQWPMRSRALAWPLLFALWANLHGGWIVGLGVLGAWGVGVALDARDWRQLLPLSALGAACLLATLATPYGVGLWLFLWDTVGPDRAITEWRPVWQQIDATPLVLWSLTAATTVFALRRAEWSWGAVIPVLLLAAGSFNVARLVGLFGLVVALLLGPRWRGGPAPAFPPALLVVLGVASLVPVVFLANTQIRCLPIETRTHPDIEAAGALASPTVRGRLMVPFDWGQYVIWHFGPRLKVSLDGRRETVYSQARLNEQHAFDDGDRAILSFIEAHRPEYIWLRLAGAAQLMPQLGEIGYRQDVTTQVSTILSRHDLPRLEESQPMPGCFQ